MVMDISGVSSGVVPSTAQNNGDTSVAQEVVRQTLDRDSQTKTETSEAPSHPTQANEGSIGSKLDAFA